MSKAKTKIDDKLWDALQSHAEEQGVRVKRCGHGTLVTDQPFEVGVLLGWTMGLTKRVVDADTLKLDIVHRTRAQDLRRECLRRLAEMHNIVALRDVKLESLDAAELRSLAIVLQGLASKLRSAEDRARRPWRP